MKSSNNEFESQIPKYARCCFLYRLYAKKAKHALVVDNDMDAFNKYVDKANEYFKKSLLVRFSEPHLD